MSDQTACAIKGLFSSCGAEAEYRCVYCARPFCSKHGAVYDEGEEVCNRKNCVAKHEDLVRHLSYKQIVLEYNQAGACGIDGCEVEMSLTCTRCKGRFCVSHATLSYESLPEGQPLPDTPPVICKHCQERRSIWARE